MGFVGSFLFMWCVLGLGITVEVGHNAFCESYCTEIREVLVQQKNQ